MSENAVNVVYVVRVAHSITEPQDRAARRVGHFGSVISPKVFIIIKKSNEIKLHAVFRTQQGRQSEPSVKILCSPLSAEFWRHYVLSGATQRRALPRQRL